jgi:hypothetical protein
MTDKHIDYDYYNTLTIKASPAKFEYHGKPNAPNLVFHDGSQTKKYISTNIYLIKSTDPNFDGELVIEHKLITNYGEKMFVHFPLKTDTLVAENEIDQLLSIEPGDSLEVNLNRVITEQSECIYRKANVAAFTKPIIIKTQIMERNLINSKIVEGSCTDRDRNAILQLQNDMKTMMAHIQDNNRHGSGSGGFGSNSSSSSNSRFGSGAGGAMTEAALNDLLSKSGLQCDAIQDNSQDPYIAKIMNIAPGVNAEKIDITNPLAIILAVLISTIAGIIALIAGYKEVFKILYRKLVNIQKSIKMMSIIEGIIPFTFFLTFIILSAKEESVYIATVSAIIWIIYSIVVSCIKRGIVAEVTGASNVDELLTNERPIWKNFLLVYPLWPIFAFFDYLAYRKIA